MHEDPSHGSAPEDASDDVPEGVATDASFIPRANLPPGFAHSVGRVPDDPARPRPAATVVLMREGGRVGLEILLLRRVRSSGFVPGAWVFPGGRVDADDASDALVERLDGLDRDAAVRRLGTAPAEDPPAVAFWIAALREAFEETGILVARDADGARLPSAGTDPSMERLRNELLEDEDRFPRILDRAGGTLDAAAVAYVAHWITPVVEPRRYDTRFFAAAVGGGAVESLSVAEVSEGRWMAAAAAVDRHRAGEMPMVFPTVHTVAMLADFDSPDSVLEHFRSADVPTILPRLVRRDGGVAIEIP